MSDATTLEWAIALTVMTVAGFMRGFTGFGAALMVVPSLSLIAGPAEAVAIACLAGLPTALQLLPTAFRHAERRFAFSFAAPAFLAAPIGAYVLVITDPAAMRIAIGGAVTLMALLLLKGWTLRRPPRIGLLAAIGAAAGLIQGAANIGGPPAVAVALARPAEAATQRANVIAAVAALAFANVVPYWHAGLFTTSTLTAALILAPIHVLAAWLGARRFEAGRQTFYRKAALGLLLLVGLATLAVSLGRYVSA